MIKMGIPNSTSDSYSGVGTAPILTTKLYRPPITPDLEARTSLLRLLDENRHRPLTLISAPAGYGKSTLASMWLEASDSPSAWISLDEGDNDLSTFVSYLLAAVSRTFPGIKLQTWNLLEAPALATVRVIARYILNDLEQISEPFLLALDDVYMVHEQPVFELLGELLRLPVRTMHLVLVTRRDPPLPIASMRARRQLTEIRSRHLRITVMEAKGILTRMLRQEIDETTAAKWTERTEGWVTALHLAALSIAQRGRATPLSAEITAAGRYLQDYLLAEVLEHLESGLRERLLATSLLDRFCGSLCEAVWPMFDASDEEAYTGEQFVNWLLENNLFLIRLDDDYHWFRFHHLFQNILQKLLRDGTVPAEIADIHRRASQWYAENGLIDEGIRHALAADDGAMAIRHVVQNRYELMNTEQWHRLRHWLQQLPDELVAESAYINSTIAMLAVQMGKGHDMMVHAKRAEDLLSSRSVDVDERRIVRAEVSVFYGIACVSQGHPDSAIVTGQRAHEQLPSNALSFRAHAQAVEAACMQMQGEFNRAVEMLGEALRDPSWPDPIRPRILQADCIISFMEGELVRLKSVSQELLRLGQRLRLPIIVSMGSYWLAVSHYLRDELHLAEHYLLGLIEKREFGAPSYVAHGAHVLACIQLARGNESEARQTIETVKHHFLEVGHSNASGILAAAEIDLALRTGDLGEARRKSASITQFDMLPPIWFWYIPQLTPIKLLLAERKPKSLAAARGALAAMDEEMGKIYRKTVRIDVLSLLSLVCDAQGEPSVACEKLAEAVALAEPGGFVRNFVDLGQPMADLLTRLRERCKALAPEAHAHIDRILDAFDGTVAQHHPSISTKIATPDVARSYLDAEPLTQRESQILRLLASDLAPAEMARELSLSVTTVRTHIRNVYSKLDVHNRYEAITRAIELDLI